jgi:cobalt-zinc-cadmium efflux system membrane fusion protein
VSTISIPPPPALPRAKRGRIGFAFGAVSGSLVTALITVFVLPKLLHVAPPPTPAAFAVEGDAVRLKPKAVPMSFETARAELGPPLARNPVTARVATVESRTAPSFAPLDGRVLQLAVHVGDRVKQGDRLVLVRSGDLASMQRDLRAAQLSIRTKQALADRLKILVDSRAASQNDLLVAQSELSEANLSANAAGAKLTSLSVKQEDETSYWVLATRSGTVVQLDAAPGKQVGPDKDKPIATVADLDEVLVVGDVPQKEAGTVSVGMDVAVSLPGVAGQETMQGRVEVVSDMIDPERQTVPIRIKVVNTGHRLKPNEFVQASFAPPASEDVLKVATDAVVSDGAVSVVFVELSPGVLRRRPVKLGRQNRQQTEILGGLTEGERVVVRGALLLLNAVDVKG